MKMVHVLVGAIVVAAAIGGIRSMSHPTSPKPSPIVAAPDQKQRAAAPAPAPAQDDAAGSLSGEVLELIDVPNYSYMRIGQKGTEGKWVAVPTALLQVGAQARVTGAMKMANFQSTALKRTFPEIYFGTLATGDAPRAAGANPHATGAGQHATGAGPQGGAKGDPHAGQPQPAATAVEVKAVPKASGPDGRTVAEAIAQRTQLAGKNVRIRGTVVKATNGVMGTNYVHMRDGSGNPAAQTNDITITTAETLTVGEVVLIEGTLATDIDIGSGYKFATIIQNAKVVKE